MTRAFCALIGIELKSERYLCQYYEMRVPRSKKKKSQGGSLWWERSQTQVVLADGGQLLYSWFSPNTKNTPCTIQQQKVWPLARKSDWAEHNGIFMLETKYAHFLLSCASAIKFRSRTLCRVPEVWGWINKADNKAQTIPSQCLLWNT